MRIDMALDQQLVDLAIPFDFSELTAQFLGSQARRTSRRLQPVDSHAPVRALRLQARIPIGRRAREDAQSDDFLHPRDLARNSRRGRSANDRNSDGGRGVDRPCDSLARLRIRW